MPSSTGNFVKVFWIFRLALGLAWVTPGFASQLAKVDSSTVELFDAPRTGARVLQKVDKDSPFAISNLPVQGYYRARMSNGEIGWVNADQVSLIKNLPEAAGTEGLDQLTTDNPASSTRVENDPLIGQRQGRLKKNDGRVTLSFFGTLGTVNPVALNAAVGAAQSSLPFGGGTEFAISLGGGSNLVLRGEYYSKSLGTADLYTMNAIPVHLGYELFVVNTEGFRLGLDLYAGVSLSNQTTYLGTVYSQALALSGLGGISVEVDLSDAVYLVARGLYRYNPLPAASPTTAGASALAAQSLVIDYSGLAVDFGLGFKF